MLDFFLNEGLVGVIESISVCSCIFLLSLCRLPQSNLIQWIVWKKVQLS